MGQSSMTFPAALHEDNYSQKRISIGMKADICQENYANSLQTNERLCNSYHRQNFTPVNYFQRGK